MSDEILIEMNEEIQRPFFIYQSDGRTIYSEPPTGATLGAIEETRRKGARMLGILDISINGVRMQPRDLTQQIIMERDTTIKELTESKNQIDANRKQLNETLGKVNRAKHRLWKMVHELEPLVRHKISLDDYESAEN
jgi:hypothetical protein